MADYYVNANSTSPTSPYSTPATGAHSLYDVNQSGLIDNGDTILVCSDLVESQFIMWAHGITVKSVDTTQYCVSASSNSPFSLLMNSCTSAYGFTIDTLRLENMQIFGPPPIFPHKGITLRNLYFKSDQAVAMPPMLTPEFVIENCVFEMTNINGTAGLIPFYCDDSNSNIPKSVIVQNNVFVYNTTFNNSENDYANTLLYAMPPTATVTLETVKIVNNIAYNKKQGYPNTYLNLFNTNIAFSSEVFTMENNNIYDNGHFIVGTEKDSYTLSDTNTMIDPKFISIANDNFYLNKQSDLYGTGYNRVMIGLGMFLLNVYATAALTKSIVYQFA